MPTHMPNWLAHRAAVMPDKPALLAEGAAWSFADLNELATRMARRLLAEGAQPGERLALLMRNSPALVGLLHAAPRVPAVLVPLNTRLAPAELAWQLGDSGAATLIYDADNAELAARALALCAHPPRALTIVDDVHQGDTISEDAPQRVSTATDTPLGAALRDTISEHAPRRVSTATDTPLGAALRDTISEHAPRRDTISGDAPQRVSTATDTPLGAALRDTISEHAPRRVSTATDTPLGAALRDTISEHAPQRDTISGDAPQRVSTATDTTDTADTIDLDAVFAIIYTSGTTGRPKGAMLTYGNFWWSAVGSALNLGTQAGDRWLAALPLFHVGGLSIVLRGAIYGIATVLHRSFDPQAVNRSIDEDGVTIISVVSAMVQRLLDARGERPYPPTLRCMLLGGGPAPLPLLEACAARGIPIVQTYGMTEAASQVATLAPSDALRKLGSAGMPLLPTELRIERDAAPAPPGAVGEIVVRGPTVMRGYINQPEATSAALAGGWLHTGDLGYLDAQGYLYVVSRRSDLIISGGENVYPAEVEAALLAHPAVAEAAVLGLPDARWGQVPVAALALRPGASLGEAEAIAFCRARLAGYKAPRAVRFVAALPRNAAGKVLRGELLALFA